MRALLHVISRNNSMSVDHPPPTFFTADQWILTPLICFRTAVLTVIDWLKQQAERNDGAF